jgi:molybdopterin-binding protein
MREKAMEIQAINVRIQFKGQVTDIIRGDVLSEIDVETPWGVVSSVITTRAMDELQLKAGSNVIALVKSTEVAIAKSLARGEPKMRASAEFPRRPDRSLESACGSRPVADSTERRHAVFRDAAPIPQSPGALPGFYRLQDVMRACALSRSTKYRRIAEGKFPAPVRLGGRASGWSRAALQQWIEDPEAYRVAPPRPHLNFT